MDIIKNHCRGVKQSKYWIFTLISIIVVAIPAMIYSNVKEDDSQQRSKMNKNYYFHVVGRSPNADGGIYSYKMDSANAKPEQIGFTALNEASYLISAPDRKLFYATGRVDKDNYVATLQFNQDHSLTLLNTDPSEGASTCHLTTVPGGNFLYTANYSSGDFTEFSLKNGVVDKLIRKIAHSGSGPNKPRQNGPHPHYVGVTPDEKYVYIVDLGIDAIKAYPFHPENGIDINAVKTSNITPRGSGPRHLVFDSSGKIAYLLNELGNTVISLSYANGIFTQLNEISTLPRFFSGKNDAAAIRISADGRFLFASNRGFDSIACFELNGDGTMKLYDLVYSGGGKPRDINFLPGGKMFAAANEAGNVAFFDYDLTTGKLTPNGLSFKIPGALCIFPE